MIHLIEIHRKELYDLCQKYRVAKLFLFGSYARNEMRDGSDIDMLVEFSQKIELLDYADNYFRLKFALEDLLKKEIDLVSVNSLKNKVLIEEINNSKIELYAA